MTHNSIVEKARALVTGGAGFIGSNLCKRLLNNSYHVRIIDNLATGNLDNIKDFQEKVQFIEGDIRDIKLIEECMKDIDIIFHQAALPSVPRSIDDPISANEVNIVGTLNILSAARDFGIKRVVYASSSSVYGDSLVLPKTEEMPTNPRSPYALTKYAGERYCQLFYEIYGLETVCLRYFNVFGPKQNPSSQYAAVIPKFIKAIIDDRPINIYGDGEQTRDFTYIDNVVEANISAAFSKKGVGEVFNIACGKRISINDLAEFLMKEMGKQVKIVKEDERKGEVKHSIADITKARKILGYEPTINVWEGLRRSVSCYRGEF